MSKRFLAWSGFLLAGLAPAFAAHPFFCTISFGNKVAVVSAEGKIEWEVRLPAPAGLLGVARRAPVVLSYPRRFGENEDGGLSGNTRRPDTEVQFLPAVARRQRLIVETARAGSSSVTAWANIAKGDHN